jgi:hypothetical protein
MPKKYFIGALWRFYWHWKVWTESPMKNHHRKVYLRISILLALKNANGIANKICHWHIPSKNLSSFSFLTKIFIGESIVSCLISRWNIDESFCSLSVFVEDWILFLYLMTPNHNNEIIHNKLQPQQKYISKTKFTNTNFAIHLNSSSQ